MPITFEVVENKSLVYVRATGVLTLADNLAVFEALLADPRFKAGFSQLCDFRDAKDALLGRNEVQEIVSLEKQHLDLLAGSRMALIAPVDFAFGLGRMWEIMAERLPFDGKVFRTLDEALAWLGLTENDLPSSCPR